MGKANSMSRFPIKLRTCARAIAYHEKIVYSGPEYTGMKVDGNKVSLSFKHVGDGLMAKEGALKGFTICGADRKFVPAEAAIVGDTVVVSSASVENPVAVRYGWENYPVVNLYNKEGLPASPFRANWLARVSNGRPSSVVRAVPTHSPWKIVFPPGHAGSRKSKQSY